MDGFEALGAEELGAFDYKSFLKETTPEVVSAVTKSLDEKKADKKVTDTGPHAPPSGGGGSWLTRPSIGGLPGWGVLGLLAAVAGGGWWYLKR